MGWWNATADGGSMNPQATGLKWGDDATEILDEALVAISDLFIREQGRAPTQAELIAGLRFSMAGKYDPS